jgi:putative transposase
MQLVERHVISKTDPRFAAIDAAAFASKNLYNAANYLVRQSFIHEGIYLNSAAIFHLIKQHEAYCALPRKVSYDVLRQLDKNWREFFNALAAWQKDPALFLGRPKLPNYKDKQQGRNILIYDIQAISLTGLRKGEIIPSQLGIKVYMKQTNVKQVRIAPRKGYYIVEVVYERGARSCIGQPRAPRWYRHWPQQPGGDNFRQSELRAPHCQRSSHQVDQPVL